MREMTDEKTEEKSEREKIDEKSVRERGTEEGEPEKRERGWSGGVVFPRDCLFLNLVSFRGRDGWS